MLGGLVQLRCTCIEYGNRIVHVRYQIFISLYHRVEAVSQIFKFAIVFPACRNSQIAGGQLSEETGQTENRLGNVAG
ncbi:hypothetical protein D3C72_2303600 [compost metagenome]